MVSHSSTLFVLLLVSCAARGFGDDAPATSAELFVQDKVWTAHLAVDAQAWQTMEPAGGGGWGIMFGAGRRPADPPASLFAAAILRRGDADKDARVDARELRALAARWFDRWDATAAGSLDAARLTAGLDATLDPEPLARGFPISLRAADGKRNGLASAFGWEFEEVPAALTFAGRAFEKVALRYKGNGTFKDSQHSIKRSLKVDLNQFAQGRALAGAAKLNFHNNVTDPSGMAESIAYRLYRDAGVPAPRTAYVKVSVTVPGTHDRRYFGLYGLVENVDARFAQDRFGTKRGAIFKPSTFAPFADLGDDWADYNQAYDPKTDLTPAQAKRVIDLAHLVTYADDATFAANVGRFLDLDQVARYMAVTVFLSTLDSVLYTGQNYYLYLDPATDRFRIIPWDLDHAFGSAFAGGAQLTKLSIRKPWVGPNRFLERLFALEAFERAYLARMGEFARTIFKPERFHAQVDALAAAIRPAVEAESKQRVEAFDRSVAGDPALAGPGASTRPAAAARTFAPRPVRSIKRFVDARTPSVLDQLAGKTAGEPGRGMGSGRGRTGDTAGPGRALTPGLLAALKPAGAGRVTRAEFLAGLDRCLAAWDADASGSLSREELHAGIEKNILPPTPPSWSRWLPASRPATQPIAK